MLVLGSCAADALRTSHISLKSACIRVILINGITVINGHVDTMLVQILKIATIVHDAS
jgi:hypothetical protein